MVSSRIFNAIDSFGLNQEGEQKTSDLNQKNTDCWCVFSIHGFSGLFFLMDVLFGIWKLNR